MLKKIDGALFQNASRKIERLTKILVIVSAVIGVFLIVNGLMSFLTYISYGWDDADVIASMTKIGIGVFAIVGVYWIGLLSLGFAKITKNAEYQSFLDEELFDYDECDTCTEETCDGCELADTEETVCDCGEDCKDEACDCSKTKETK